MIDNDGNGIAVWEMLDSTGFDNIYSNQFTGNDWIKTDNLDRIGLSGSDAFDPQIAGDGNGKAVAVWNQRRDPNSVTVYALWYNNGSWVGQPEKIGIDTGNSGLPNAAINKRGDVVVGWSQDDGTKKTIYANNYIAGKGWTGPRPIEPDDNVDSWYAPSVAIDESGNAIAVWEPESWNAVANRYVAGKDWGTPELIGEHGSQQPRVAIDGSGKAIAVWARGNDMFANRFE